MVHSGHLQESSIFDNSTPDSLVGSLKRFVVTQPRKQSSIQVVAPTTPRTESSSGKSMFGDEAAQLSEPRLNTATKGNATTEVAVSEYDKSIMSPKEKFPVSPGTVLTERETCTPEAGFKHTVRNRREAKMQKVSIATKSSNQRKKSRSVVQALQMTSQASAYLSDTDSRKEAKCRLQIVTKSEVKGFTENAGSLGSDSKKSKKTKTMKVTSTDEKSQRGDVKRKRKTEKQLACLQNELRCGNLLWSREKILELSKRTNMTETSVYKWWWD